jgi:putative CocE/NonD family hydrolase
MPLLKRSIFLVLLIVATTSVTFSYSQTTPEIVVEHNIAMKTRDGLTLRADIYRPAGDQELPVLLQRTPYNKSNGAHVGRQAAARGFLVVIQDVRGRYASDGEWYPFKYETNDGFDTVEWAASLPHANGKVGMFGGSYVGATQMLAAVAHPPHLAGICPVVTASNYHENWAYQGGAFEQWFNESWTSGLAQDTMDRVVRQSTNAAIGSMVLPLDQYPVFNLKPLSSPADLTRKLAPYFLDWLDHPGYDSYWKQWSIEEQYASIQVPALTVAAWYDIFQDGSLRNFVGLKAHAGNQTARRQQRLLITIGGHAGSGRKIGDINFGPAAEEYNENMLMLSWYDYLLRGVQNEFTAEKPVKIFVVGENKWRLEETWPLERAHKTRYFLHSAGKANTLSGDGLLSPIAPSNEAADKYIDDPSNPVPTEGGPLCCDSEHLAPGPKDQRPVEGRPDVLVYSTLPLGQDTEVTGQIALDLYVTSSAVDTDFAAKLVDVWPDGFAQNLTEGILRARYRESTVEAKPIIPGSIYKLTIDLWSTSNVFLKGHEIRVEISSSNFPRFDRNRIPARAPSTNVSLLKANNTILHDKDHPSSIVLPVVAR